MTTELQRVMARYEDARIAYKRAVLASLNGDSSGESIRQAIGEFQRASADLQRIRGAPAAAPRAPAAPPRMPTLPGSRRPRRSRASSVIQGWTARALSMTARVQLPSIGTGIFRRLLNAE